MANTKSAAKAARQSLKRKAVNDARRSRMKSSIKASEAAIVGGDKTVATDAFKTMQAELMRGARKGVIHRNAVARKMSRLSKRIKALKNVTINEPFFVGHFPHRPVMPGVLMLEALAQTSALLSMIPEGDELAPDVVYYFVGIDEGATSVFGNTMYVHEFVHDARHFLGFPCH